MTIETSNRGRGCEIRWLGRIPYREAWELQEDLAAKRLRGEIADTLLLLEHPPTLTLGRGADSKHILADSRRLQELGVEVVETNRGGDVTYHGPGQLVGYPILNLNEPPHQPDLHRYLRGLEEALIAALRYWAIDASRFPGYTGVWTAMDTAAPAKIAAIGIRTSRWITQHGFAINVCTDLSHFNLIVPCGISDYGVTSIQRIIGQDLGVRDAVPIVAASFLKTFDLDTAISDNDYPGEPVDTRCFESNRN